VSGRARSRIASAAALIRLIGEGEKVESFVRQDGLAELLETARCLVQGLPIAPGFLPDVHEHLSRYRRDGGMVPKNRRAAVRFPRPALDRAASTIRHSPDS
jgi:hypothetical protein